MLDWFKSIFNCYSNKLSSHSQLDEIAFKWKEYVEKDHLNEFFSEVIKHSDYDLLKVKARKYADSENDTHSKSLVQYIEAELSYRQNNRNYSIAAFSAILALLVALFK